MGKLIIRYEHSDGKIYSCTEYEMDNSMARIIYSALCDLILTLRGVRDGR